MTRRNDNLLWLVAAAILLSACSSTGMLPEGEVLYTGLKKINYEVSDSDSHFEEVLPEVEAALACPPNGAILGSSFYRSPLQIGLWVSNAFSGSDNWLGKWVCNTFGSDPVLLSGVNPEVRALVAKNVLRANGYFNAGVSHEVIKGKNPKTAKIAYRVTPNDLYRIDTLQYVGYPQEIMSLVDSTRAEMLVRPGDAFSTAALDAERRRLGNLLRNNGYYYYNANYATFLADSVSKPYHVDVRVQPIADMPEQAKKKWYLGKLRVELRRSMQERLTDSIVFKALSIYYSGKKPPIRPAAVLRDIYLRPRQLYSQDNVVRSSSVLNSLGLFSVSTFNFFPRDTVASCDTLDFTLGCVLDKPLDISIEANYKLKSNDRTGPGLEVGLTKRNAFRGGEKLTFSINGSYEWQTGKTMGGGSSKINSYEYGAGLSLEYPRIEFPVRKWRRHRFYNIPSTLFSLSGNVLNRADYFKLLTVTGAVTYKFQTTANSRHEFSPFLLDYNYLSNTTQAFDSIMNANPALYVSMRNQFVPKVKYTYLYTSPSTCRNPIAWELTLTEAGNMMSLAYMAAGKKWSAKEKDLFGNPFAQFVKINTSLRKTWQLGYKSQLVGRVAAGAIFAFGNSERAPYSEQFYVGGANSLRAFTIRSIGPGKYVAPSSAYSYLDQTGDIKLECNLEWRFGLFGSLYGAMFLDAGNIWLLKKDPTRPDAEFRPQTFFKQLATGTGVGLRYDLDFFVLRLDLGIALHVPYETGKSGYYNIPKFKDGLGFHFAIGYPF